MNTRHGRQQGTWQMIELLEVGASQGWSRLQSAVEQALSLGCHDVAAIRHLLMAGQFERPVMTVMEIGGLARYERTLPELGGYDRLLGNNSAEVQV